MSLAEDAVPKQETTPRKTEFIVAQDPLSQLFKPLFDDIIAQLPKWFVEDQTISEVVLKLTNGDSSYYFGDNRTVEISISFSEIMMGFYSFYAESPQLKTELEQVFKAQQAEEPIDAVMIPREMTKLAEELAISPNNRKKVIKTIHREIENTLLHERGHALFHTYREAILKKSYPLPDLEKEMGTKNIEDAEREIDVAVNRLRTAHKLNFSTLTADERLVNTQEWADEMFQFMLKKLPTDFWKNIAIDRYLGFLEELFVRIALYSQQTPNLTGLRWRISDELFFDTDINNGYGFSLRVDCSILDYLEANGVKKTLDHLMQLYSQEAAFEVLKERLPEIWQVVKNQK